MDNVTAPLLNELVPMPKLQKQLVHIFPSMGSLEWHFRQHRKEYIAAGAIVEIAGRLLAHPPTFKYVALDIGKRTLAERHNCAGS
jgi:hypothetical protein